MTTNNEKNVWPQFLWLTGGLSVSFLVPFVSVSLGALSRPFFVAIHALISGMFLILYFRWAGLDWSDLKKNPVTSLLMGGLTAIFSVAFVLSQPASQSPEGLKLGWNILWLGVVYRLVDAMLLSVFPVSVITSMAQKFDFRTGIFNPNFAGVMALAVNALITTTYHLGFPEFRSALILSPIIGNTVFTLAYILSRNPLVPTLSHIALHIVAVIHAYGTSVPLPPHY